MDKKITCYIDCVSPYSFHAFTYLQRHADALKELGVEVEFVPVFLGGINVGSGNKPPWTLPAKAAYTSFDGKRAQEYFGNYFEPQRALTYIKQTTPKPTYEKTYLICLETLWKDQLDISKPEHLSTALRHVFDQDKVNEILTAAANPQIKAHLAAVTEKVVKEQGAFGCPWFWVRNAQGKEEPFFGSDRFHYMWQFLGLPFEDLRLRSRI